MHCECSAKHQSTFPLPLFTDEHKDSWPWRAPTLCLESRGVTCGTNSGLCRGGEVKWVSLLWPASLEKAQLWGLPTLCICTCGWHCLEGLVQETALSPQTELSPERPPEPLPGHVTMADSWRGFFICQIGFHLLNPLNIHDHARYILSARFPLMEAKEPPVRLVD